MSDAKESMDRRAPDREPTVGDAVRVLEAQLAFWRRQAFIFGGGLVLSLIVILIGLGALLSIAGSAAVAADKAEDAAKEAKEASATNVETLAIIKEQTGPEARARSQASIAQITLTINCDFRRAAIEAGLNVPADYLDRCPPPDSATTTTTAPEE